MNGPDISARARRFWVLGVMLTGIASQYCLNFGICAVPL